MNATRFILTLVSILQLFFSKVTGIRTCSKINTEKDFEDVVNSGSNRIILTCPFLLKDRDVIEITTSNITIACLKEFSSDTCKFNSKSKQLKILGDSVTFLGYEFIKSQEGAVEVLGESPSFIDCSFNE